MVSFLSHSLFFTPHHITLESSFPSPVPPYATLHVFSFINILPYFFSSGEERKISHSVSGLSLWTLFVLLSTLIY